MILFPLFRNCKPGSYLEDSSRTKRWVSTRQVTFTTPIAKKISKTLVTRSLRCRASCICSISPPQSYTVDRLHAHFLPSSSVFVGHELSWRAQKVLRHRARCFKNKTKKVLHKTWGSLIYVYHGVSYSIRFLRWRLYQSNIKEHKLKLPHSVPDWEERYEPRIGHVLFSVGRLCSKCWPRNQYAEALELWSNSQGGNSWRKTAINVGLWEKGGKRRKKNRQKFAMLDAQARHFCGGTDATTEFYWRERVRRKSIDVTCTVTV